MENSQNQLEKLKNFPIESILTKYSYIEVLINENWLQGYIKDVKPNNRYDIIAINISEKTTIKNNLTAKEVAFLGCHNFHNNNIREIYLDEKMKDIDINNLNSLILKKLAEINIDINIINREIEQLNIEKESEVINISDLIQNNDALLIKDTNNNEFNITGYHTIQFFSGFYIDILVYINNTLSNILKESIEKSSEFEIEDNFKQIIYIVLDLGIFALSILKNNIKQTREYIQINRKFILIDKISSIINSIDIILSNILLIFCYRFYNYTDIEKRLVIINKICYDIIINNNQNELPMNLLLSLINFITYEDNIIRISNFDKNKVYKAFLNMMKNLTETDIKYIKNILDIKNYCSTIIKRLYNKEIKVLVNNCYYNFLINCLTKCNILEKKIAALNCINDIILTFFEKEDEINPIFYDFFFNKNKILNIFFEETVHNEILKRSIELFKYLSTYDKLYDEFINKLIKLDTNNNIARNILCEIIKKRKSVEEKTDLFIRMTKDFNFDDNNNQNNIIDFVTKLTIACLDPQENKANLENDVTNGNSSYNDSFNDKNIFNDNYSKRSNIQIIKLPGMMKNNTSFKNSKISRNISNKSIEGNNLERRENNIQGNNNKKQLYKKKYYYGLDMFFKYILYTYNEKKAIENKNVNISKAIKSFKYILDMSIEVIKMSDLFYFLNELFDNIKSNKKHNSVVQSLILIEILLNKIQKNEKNDNRVLNNNRNSSLSNVNCEDNEIVNILDEKYDIITLISNDLIRYVNQVKEICDKDKNKKINYKENIFEGIYNYKNNISIRLKLLFFLEYFDLNINHEHIKKIYNLFNNEESKEEKLLLFREISNNILYIKASTLNKIFIEIFQDKNEFDINNFDDEESFSLIKEIFIAINIDKHTLLDDSKVIKVNADLNQILGINFLFNILISNRNPIIIKRLCNILSHFCYFLVTYTKNYPSKYWNSFIDKITDFMELCNKNKNIEGIYALARLTKSIYNFNFSFRIPTKEDVHEIKDPYFIYQFCCPSKGNKNYKLKVGKHDKMYLMRWKLAYYFDLYVNDVVFGDIDDKKYNLLYDDEKFDDIFPNKKYHKNIIHFEMIKVYEIPNQILSVPDNPCQLIEKNEKIINILIGNLKDENNDIEQNIENNNDNFLIKKEIWNILENLPKQKYSELLINKFDAQKGIKEEEFKKIIGFDEIFILTYNLQCLIQFLSKDDEKEKEKDKEIEKQKQKQINIFLTIFTNLYHLDKMLYLDFIKRDINKNLKDEKTQFIYFEYIKHLLIMIQIIEDYKRKKNIILNKSSKNEGRDTILSKHEMDLDATKLHSISGINDSILHIMGYKSLFDKITDIIIIILNDNSIDNESICFEIIQEILNLVESLKNIDNIINNNYFEFIFDADILFKKIFIYDFIKSQKNEVKNLLSDFLLKNLFDNHSHNNLRYNTEEGLENKKYDDNKNIKIFFEIILSPEIFSFLLNNQYDGSYFYLISSLIEKYINSKKKIINILNSQKDIKNIIDMIITTLNDKNNIEKSNDICLLNYPYYSDNSNISKTSTLTKIDTYEKDKNDFINGILLYLLRILELSQDCPSIIDYFLNKIDVCNFFLMKGILNKCNKNPLFSDDTTYSDFNSHKNIYQILIFILKYLDNTKNIIEDKNYLPDSLYMKIWKILNRLHKLDFWKKSKNFEMNFNDRDRKEFIGLRNMSSTCYMNSILQQFFMIPMLRETILNINNDKQDTILYQLQLTFAALKAYEFKYYDPKYFVTVSKLSFFEQMDADEYYGLLVDKLENDINNLNKNEIDTKSQNYKNLFKFFFGIKLTDELYFIECDHKRYNESFCYNIQLEVKNYNNIVESLKNYFKTEIMSGDNKIICEECKTKRICHKKLKLKSLPNILVISLKRFDYDYRTMTKFKLNNYFEFPFELNISEFLIQENESSEKNGNDNNLYELTGITIHYGVSDYGHYYDLIKAANNKWYKFNDTFISEFSENDIPKEAFGDKESTNIDLEEDITTNKAETKEKDNKNAYILIYTKKSFNNDSKKYSNNEYNTKLVFPPYSKLSNINQSMESYINYKMFKYWCLENLADSNYQNFILELLKLDLVKNINKEIDNSHSALIENLKKGNYLPIKNYINTGVTIFSFGLLFCCNILNRCPKEKNIAHLFEDVIVVYLDNDPKKCLYVLEEFSNFEVLDEFIFYCEKEDVYKEMIELISIAFNILYTLVESEEEINSKYLNLLIKYLHTIIIYIEKVKNIAIKNLSSFENLATLLYKLLYKKRILLDYIKNNKIDKWLEEIMDVIDKKLNEATNTIETKNNDDIKNEDEIPKNNNINETNFPLFESNHCILLEKTDDFKFGIEFNKNIEITAVKTKNVVKKNYDGFAFIKLLLEDLKVVN